jgi:hypothetical protein
LSPEIQIPEVESRGGSKVVVSDYDTRSKSRNSQVYYCLVLSVEEEDSEEEGLLERPPMPAVPSARARAQDPLWISAGRRETEKLLAEDTFLPLPKDKYGRFIRPEGAIVLRLLKIAEYKWKPDPITGKERWLECYRYVCDGSTDDREEKLYAETPDRTLLFLIISIEASLGIEASSGDAVRAYLNALSIDRNIVIHIGDGFEGLPIEALLNKGLFCSRGGALSWEKFIDPKLEGVGYVKQDVARGVYLKVGDSGEPVRLYRHSDDFRLSCANKETRTVEEERIRSIVRMSEFKKVDRFLGVH